MATGGYKCVQFQWTGGRTDTVLERVNYVLTGIVEAIVGSGTEWALDTSMGQTSSSWYHELTMSNSAYKAIVKFIVNSSSNIRLAIGYVSMNAVPTTTIENADRFKTGTSSYNNLNGLFVSTCDTSVSFDITQTGKISLPEQATRWLSCYGSSSSAAGNGSFVNENQYTYTYNMIVKGGQIVFLFRSSNWGSGLYKGFAVGRIIGTIAHSEDSDGECNLGCFTLGNNANAAEYAAPTSVLINTESSYFSSDNFNCFFKADTAFDKSVISFADDGNTKVNVSISNTIQLGANVANPEAGTGGRWCPLQVYVTSTDPSLYGIVSGDGFKGYLDTDLIRGVTVNTYSKGQTFGANSEFIYIGGGIAIGWDSTNTISLF